MKILIVGASGFIGNQLIQEMLIQVSCGGFFSKKLELVFVARKKTLIELRKKYDGEFYEYDGVRFPQQALDHVQAVVHLAGESIADGRWSAEVKNRIYDSRVKGVESLVRAMREYYLRTNEKPAVLISGSAIGIYGDGGSTVFDESSELSQSDKVDPSIHFLQQTCLDWEGAAYAAKEIGVRVVCLRTGIVLGKTGGSLEKMAPIFAAGLGGPIGSGQQWMSWIHVADLIQIIIRCLTDVKLSGPVNGVSPSPVQNYNFSKSLARCFNKMSFIPVPKFVLKAVLGDFSAVVLSSQNVLPRVMIESGFHFRFSNLDSALRDIYPEGFEDFFYAEKWIPEKIENVFNFFSLAENLETITPPWLGFKIIKKSDDKMREGLLIDYRLSIHGIPLFWKTKILEWKPVERFVDYQVKGPYQLWHHSHQFYPINNGVYMVDRVRYKIPFGFLGKLIAGSKIRADILKIFQYREKIISEKFKKE